MIEGLRVLPWFQAATNDPETTIPHLRDCTTCRRHTPTVETRRRMGCGWEPPQPLRMAWWPEGLDRETDDLGSPTRVETCPGYTTQLPQVVEAAACMLQWKHGTLTEWLGHEPPRPLLAALAVIESNINAMQGYRARPKDPGPGRKAR